jgi:hypothetical protein
MKLIAGSSLLFYIAVVLSFFISLFSEKSGLQITLQHLKSGNWKPILPQLFGSLLLVAVLCGCMVGLNLQIASAWSYMLGSTLLIALLTALQISAELRGLILITMGFAVFSTFGDASNLALPVLASLLGLMIGKLGQSATWEDFTLPATWLAGLYWIVTSVAEKAMPEQASLLTLMLAMALLLRAAQAVPLLRNIPSIWRALFLTVTAGLGGWLVIQNILLQPALLPWAGLFAGGTVLGFLIPSPVAVTDVSRTSSDEAGPTQIGLIALLLTGIATLIASRLFDSLGWVILAAGFIVNRQSNGYVDAGALFLLSRLLLQAFLVQYNANVTGINITHPYASAAMFAGFAGMLIITGWFKWLAVSTDSPDRNAAFNQSMPQHVTQWLLCLGTVLVAGLSNYFLHAEATASLLLALVVTGVCLGYLANFKSPQLTGMPLMLTLLSLCSVLAMPEVLNWGNEAEKNQKLIVLGVALLLFVIGGVIQRFSSGRKPIQVT